MIQHLRRDAEMIARKAIEAVKPDAAVKQALAGAKFPGRVFLVAAGKAAWQMASAALSCLGPIAGGVVITKYGHVVSPLPGVTCYEGGHPVPDENGFLGTQAALELTADLNQTDTVLFLLSGGGSALFEKPLVSTEELRNVTQQLLAAGADIGQINTIRKRLSAVKAGRFALHCAPAQVRTVVLSDVLGDRLDVIASGPAAADPVTAEEALAIARQYQLTLSEKGWECLKAETPKSLDNVTSTIIGSVRQLCLAAEKECVALGYEPIFLTDRLSCEAKDAGVLLASHLTSHANEDRKLAIIAGGETVVRLTGSGKGGRNQELALAAAPEIKGLPACIISVGSDGTDGPTDAAGGYADGDTAAALAEKGWDVAAVLRQNDSYHALLAVDGLIFTGPTGTNVNDLYLGLLG